MAIFGWNGLQFLGLDLLLIFAVYGMNPAFMTVAQVGTVGRAARRKAISASKGSKREKEQAAVEFRTAVVKAMGDLPRYAGTSAEFRKSYIEKTYVR